MGCCFKNKIKGKKYDSRKVEESIKEVKNNMEITIMKKIILRMQIK